MEPKTCSDLKETSTPSATYGHRRQPALGKAMPVTSLLLNYPITKASHTRGGEHELPPLYFSIHDENMQKKCADVDKDEDQISSEDEVEPAYELLVSDCSSSDRSESFVKIDKSVLVDNFRRRDGNNPDDPHMHDSNILGNADTYKPCLTCTNNAPHDFGERPNAINEMCRRLCTDECRLRLSLAGFVPPPNMEEQQKTIIHELEELNIHRDAEETLIPPPSMRLSIQRKRFLDDILRKPVSDTDSEYTDEPMDAAPKSQLYAIVNDLVKAKGSKDDAEQHKDFQDQHDIAEALAKTSAMTSTSQMKQRLAARKLEIELDNSRKHATDVGDATKLNTIAIAHMNVDNGKAGIQYNETMLGVSDAEDVDPVPLTSASVSAYDEYVPPRDLLLYLVRMGSFNSAPKINNNDSQDDDFKLPNNLNSSQLLKHIRQLRGDHMPPLLARNFFRPFTVDAELSEDLNFLNLDSSTNVDGRIEDMPKWNENTLRIFQWNILSQTLGQYNDNFIRCPVEALSWQNRKFLIVEEILRNNPDVICLQEVDHFKFLKIVLGSQNYEGVYFPKPDSPCLYIDKNNGPDGCAIFYKSDKYELKKFATRVLEVWRVQSNQVAIAAILQSKKNSRREFCICTTHLKARHGSLLAKLRNEQGRDLIRFVKNFAEERPVILCGDFNAEPTEPVYTTILTCDILKLSSAYADISSQTDKCQHKEHHADTLDIAEDSIKREPPYTTWKIRESGEECHTIDYVFYTQEKFKVKNCLDFPQGDEIGIDRTPCIKYPSDHFSLVCDFEFLNEQDTETGDLAGDTSADISSSK